MRIFNELVFDGFITGTTIVYTDPKFDLLIGQPDQLSISGYATQSVSTSPTITVQVEHSFDQVRWRARNATPEVNAVALLPAAEQLFQAPDGDSQARPALPFARLAITLGSSSGIPSCQVRIWACGRDVG